MIRLEKPQEEKGPPKVKHLKTETKKGRAIGKLSEEIPRLVQALTAKGRELSPIEYQGEGYLGVLRLLNSEGPQTVPQIARRRGVSRQRIQKLSNNMADNGLIRFVDNPDHRSSRLVQLTQSGIRHEDKSTALFSEYAEQHLEPKITLTEIQTTLDVMQRLLKLLEG